VRWLVTNDRCGRKLGRALETQDHVVVYFARPDSSATRAGYSILRSAEAAAPIDVVVVVDARITIGGNKWASPLRDDVRRLQRRGVAVVFAETRDPGVYGSWRRACKCRSRGARPYDASIYMTTDAKTRATAAQRSRAVLWLPLDYADTARRLAIAASHAARGVTYVPARDDRGLW